MHDPLSGLKLFNLENDSPELPVAETESPQVSLMCLSARSRSLSTGSLWIGSRSKIGCTGGSPRWAMRRIGGCYHKHHVGPERRRWVMGGCAEHVAELPASPRNRARRAGTQDSRVEPIASAIALQGGRSRRECWSEIWPIMNPMPDHGFRTGGNIVRGLSLRPQPESSARGGLFYVFVQANSRWTHWSFRPIATIESRGPLGISRPSESLSRRPCCLLTLVIIPWWLF